MVKVFLGGTCNESTWRDELKPMLTIDYFDPVVNDWNEDAQRREAFEKATCDFRLYVITSAMTGVYSIAEVVDDSNKRPDGTIFCILEDGFTEGQLRSLHAVAKMVRDNGATVCTSLESVAEWLNRPENQREHLDANITAWGHIDCNQQIKRKRLMTVLPRLLSLLANAGRDLERLQHTYKDRPDILAFYEPSAQRLVRATKAEIMAFVYEMCEISCKEEDK